MLKKLLPLYKNSILHKVQPVDASLDTYIFFNEAEKEWIEIPKSEINHQEFTLLKTLYPLIDLQRRTISREAADWQEFIFHNGDLPAAHKDGDYRFILFSIMDEQVDQMEIESALKGFFTEKAIIIWENNSFGAVIEEKKNVFLSDKDLISLSDILESDFYIKADFYIGKFHPFSNELPHSYQCEKEYFDFGRKLLKPFNIFTFEKVFPTYIASHLSDEIIQRLNKEITQTFNEDPELFSTIKVFLENNLNASVTAKKLYIHRNTLQYRIDKFVEKTGIALKDFYGAFTVFLACLLYEMEQKK